MVIPRCQLVPEARIPSAHHLISRCVRRGFLLRDDEDKRRQLLEDSLNGLIQTFAIDLCAYALMHNHFHCVVIVRPDQADAWSAQEVAERWCSLVLKRRSNGQAIPWSAEEIAHFAQDPEWVATKRERLWSMSWLMRLLKQRLARRFNSEDNVTGHFWEGRFENSWLPDQAALTACMMYNDLNPIRANMASLPELSDFTSIQRRIAARQDHQCALEMTQQVQLTDEQLANDEDMKKELEFAKWRAEQGPSYGLVILPTTDCIAPTQLPYTYTGMSEDDYITLLDCTGRAIATGKRGAIDKEALPILERLGLQVDRWLQAMVNPEAFTGRMVGDAAARAKAAARAGLKWIKDKTGLYQEPVPGPDG